MFTFLFKYPPSVFGKSEFAFGGNLRFWQLGLIVVALGVLLFLIHHGSVTSQLSLKNKRILLVLRTGFFLALGFLLMRPSLILSSLVPRENLLAILVDNSRSMSIPESGVARGENVLSLLKEDSSFLTALDEKFYLRFFRFDSSSERMEPPFQLDWQGEQTSIAKGLEKVLAEHQNLPLAGILLITDGSDNSHRDLNQLLEELKAKRIPVHTIGIGPESVQRDIEIIQASTPRVAVPDSLSLARVTIRHHGFGGSRGQLEVREGNSLVQTKEIHFPRDSDTFNAEVRFLPRRVGMQVYEFKLNPLEGEQIVENNSRKTLVQVQNRKSRILYIEGRPRWEYKFIRRALAEDNHIRLETLLRTALNKFYRQGIEEETTLATGFPTDREELFAYQGVIFGSVESSFFTYAQMEMVKDFVSKRGGGFLMLGGTSSFASGQYQNTPIEDILPVWLREADDPDSLPLYRQGERRVHLTEYGERHPALQIHLEGDQSALEWNQTPELIDWNAVPGVKPGAIVLAQLQGAEDRRSSESAFPILVFQRYGRGQGLALLTGSIWRWQMLRSHENQHHETFWKQVLGWLVALARDAVTVETERDIYSQNELVSIRAEVHDKAFNRINDAQVEAILQSPSGEESRIPLRWDVREDGVYRGQWTSKEEGSHSIRVRAQAPGLETDDKVVWADTSFLISGDTLEYFNPVLKTDFLRKLAQGTGGNYYAFPDVQSLPDEILYTESHSSVIEVLELWDMPFNFLVLISFLLAEWLLRKKYGFV